MRLLLSCSQLCMFLSVVQILDDQPAISSAATERDRNVNHHPLHLLSTREQAPRNSRGETPCILHDETQRVSKEAGYREVVGLGEFFRSRPKRIFSQVRCSIVQGKHNPRSQDHCRKFTTLAPDEVTGPARSLATSYFCGAPGTGVYVLSKVNETSWYGLRCTEETLNMHVKSSAPTLKAKKKTMMRTKRKHFQNGSMWSSGGLARWISVLRGKIRILSAAHIKKVGCVTSQRD